MPSQLSIEALKADRLYVQRQINEANGGPWDTAHLMWINRLEEIDSRIESIGSSHKSYASVAVVFDGDPVIGATVISADFATSALNGFQKLVSARLAELQYRSTGEALPKRGRLPRSVSSKLYIRDLVRGSMGFILEEVPDQTEFLPSKLKEAVESTTQFLQRLKLADNEEFQRLIGESEPRVIQAVKKFASILFEAGANTHISGDEHQAVFSRSDIDQLSNRLSDVSVAEDVERLDGSLQGLFPQKLAFEFKSSRDGVTFWGSVTEELAAQYLADPAAYLKRPSVARIRSVKTSRNGIKTNEQRILEALDLIDPLPRR